jgi:hypothetical protein
MRKLRVLVAAAAGGVASLSAGAQSVRAPADNAAAIASLEKERARGADFLVFPATAFWWLDHYEEFRRHVDARYPPVHVPGDSCRIFDLAGVPDPRRGDA